MSGYRKMISNHIPRTWDMALRYLRCRDAYIERVYDCYIKPLNKNVMKSAKENNQEKERIIKLMFSKYEFKDTVKLEDLMLTNKTEKYHYWDKIKSWINWFKNHMAFIENTIKIEQSLYKTKSEIVDVIMTNYKINEKLARFIVNKVLSPW